MKGVVPDVACEKVLKAFSSQSRHVNSKTSWCNSTGKALHVGGSSVALRRPVPEISEITSTQTDKYTHTHMDYGSHTHEIRLLKCNLILKFCPFLLTIGNQMHLKLPQIFLEKFKIGVCVRKTLLKTQEV